MTAWISQAFPLPVRIKLPSKPSSATRNKARFYTFVQYGLLSVGAVVLVFATLIGFAYNKYARLTDQKLLNGPFPDASLLYAAPQTIGVGDTITPAQIALRLRESGYGEEERSSAAGWYHLRPAGIEVFPGNHSFAGAEPGVLKFANGQIASITSLSDNAPRTQYTLEPRLLSSLYDKNREKRRLVKYDDIPPLVVHAVISIEDKRFFQHSGFDPIRIVKAVWVDLKDRRKSQGASTRTQQ